MVRPDPKVQYLNEAPEFRARKRRNGYWLDIVKEFAERPEKCMVFEYDSAYDAHVAATSARYGIAKNGLKARIVRSDCTVYVIKEDGDEAKAR